MYYYAELHLTMLYSIQLNYGITTIMIPLLSGFVLAQSQCWIFTLHAAPIRRGCHACYRSHTQTGVKLKTNCRRMSEVWSIAMWTLAQLSAVQLQLRRCLRHGARRARTALRGPEDGCERRCSAPVCPVATLTLRERFYINCLAAVYFAACRFVPTGPTPSRMRVLRNGHKIRRTDRNNEYMGTAVMAPGCGIDTDALSLYPWIL